MQVNTKATVNAVFYERKYNMMQISVNEKKEALDLLIEILKIPTVNSEDNEGDLAVFLQKYFLSYGIESKVQQIDEKHANLIVDIHGEASKENIIWNGHIDTVPYGNLEKWISPPFDPVLQGDMLIARGASDMKSGLAAMVYTLCNMKAHNLKPRTNIRFIATSDEEKNGLGARKVMEDNLLGDPCAIIIGEPTGLNLGIAQKGCMWLELTVKGKVSHSAYPWEGINAIQYGTKICEKLQEYIRRDEHSLLKNSTAEITVLKGGVAPNMIPDYCNILLDIRYTPNLSQENIIQKLRGVCSCFQNITDNKLDISYKVLNNRRSIDLDTTNSWLQKMKNTIDESNLGAKYIGINYFTDASIFTEYNNIPTILFGPGSPDMAHKPNEAVDINLYHKAINILANTFYA